MVPHRYSFRANARNQVKKYLFKYLGQFGHNKAIVISSDVNLKSASFRYFVQKRGEWELNDHYASPGPIQFYG